MPYTRRPFQPETPYANQVSIELNKANDNFDILAQAFVSDNPETFKVKNSDKLDGFDASLTPQANTIPISKNDGKLDDGWLHFVENDPKVKIALNASGGAPIYACRAWVNFDGTTNPPTIRASKNISSVVKNATGDYTINLAIPMIDANYVVIFSSGSVGSSGQRRLADDVSPRTTTSFTIGTKSDSGVSQDHAQINVAIFR